jgi:hypothetical protein
MPVVALITTVPETGDGITEPKLKSSILVRVSGISSNARPAGGVDDETGAAATLVVPSAMAAIARIKFDRIVTPHFLHTDWLTMFSPMRVTDH